MWRKWLSIAKHGEKRWVLWIAIEREMRLLHIRKGISSHRHRILLKNRSIIKWNQLHQHDLSVAEHHELHLFSITKYFHLHVPERILNCYTLNLLFDKLLSSQWWCFFLFHLLLPLWRQRSIWTHNNCLFFLIFHSVREPRSIVEGNKKKRVFFDTEKKKPALNQLYHLRHRYTHAGMHMFIISNYFISFFICLTSFSFSSFADFSFRYFPFNFMNYLSNDDFFFGSFLSHRQMMLNFIYFWPQFMNWMKYFSTWITVYKWSGAKREEFVVLL